MSYTIIVVGGGHGGCEAALAAARLGQPVLLITLSIDSIAHMACNPAIGGLAKGHLVREIHALGGEMGLAAEGATIQLRRLNTRKGPAVRATRAQIDLSAYRNIMRRTLEATANLFIRQSMVEEVLVQGGRVAGVRTCEGDIIPCRAVIITTGTYLRGLLHVGLHRRPGGRAGDLASDGLSDSLKALGLPLGRLKTGTPPRLDRRTLDFGRMETQPPDNEARPFGRGQGNALCQVPCAITHTNDKTHEIILASLDRSPLYSGVIQGRGPRYCPSIEDKVVRFADRERHQVFIEPMGLDTMEIYPNGISTSLPLDVQERMVRTLVGLERAVIVRPGYAVEYDFVQPTCLEPSLECRSVPGLYLAGQINGTSGYEEAAAQGMMAGINAALSMRDQEPVVLKRHQAYMGVLIEDLVTLGTEEPYRMFTSRAEYRLLLREDNADLRLSEVGHRLGLVSRERMREVEARAGAIREAQRRLGQVRLGPGPVLEALLQDHGSSPAQGPVTLEALLRRPEIPFRALAALDPELGGLAPHVADEVEVEVKYEGYVRRCLAEVERLRSLEELVIPPSFDFRCVPGLSTEAREKLMAVAPRSLAQASRISGVTPAAISSLAVLLRRHRRA